jgi:hypothetical protein
VTLVEQDMASNRRSGPRLTAMVWYGTPFNTFELQVLCPQCLAMAWYATRFVDSGLCCGGLVCIGKSHAGLCASLDRDNTLGVVILLGGDIIAGSLGENFACSRQVAVATIAVCLCPCWRRRFGGLVWWCYL